MYKHPLVAGFHLTCESCPEQYEGKLTDGRIFYYRMRFGRAQLGVGKTLDDAVAQAMDSPGYQVGNRWQGHFSTSVERDAIFSELLDRVVETEQR